MGINFILLTKVSNSGAPTWANVAIQVSMWLAVATQIFLLVPDMLLTMRTRDTRENKWGKWVVWFICSAAWIAYTVFLTWEDIPISEVIGLAISEGINLICLFIIYGIKIYNIIIAKKVGLTEKEWCGLNRAVYVAKKTLPREMRRKLRKACKDLSRKEKAELYIDALRKHNVGHNVRHSIRHEAKKVARSVIKKAKKNKKSK